MPDQDLPRVQTSQSLDIILYRLDQSEKKDVAVFEGMKDISVQLGKLDKRLDLHMKQSELNQQSTEEKIDELTGSVKELNTSKVEQGQRLANLQITQSLAEKYGPGAGAGALFAGVITALLEVIMKLTGIHSQGGG